MKKTFAYLLVSCCLLASCIPSGTGNLPRADKETMQSFQAFGDKVFIDAWSSPTDAVHSLMVVKDGEVIYERYANGHKPEDLHIMWSASKSFTAFAICLAAEEGLLNINDKVYSYFPDIIIPDDHKEWREDMTIQDLLTMSSGLKEEKLGEVIASSICPEDYPGFDWAESALTSSMVFAPGERFYYNSMNTYLLSVIVSKVTGKTVAQYMNERVFRHLCIKEWIWEESPQGYSAGGWGLYLRTEDLAKFGLLWLNNGIWEGRKIIGEEWISEATKRHITYNENPCDGYGYQVWLSRHGSFRFHGAKGQIMMAIPEKNVILVATSAHNDDQRIINSFFENFYNQLP